MLNETLCFAQTILIITVGGTYYFYIYYYLKEIVNKTTVYCNGQTTY